MWLAWKKRKLLGVPTVSGLPTPELEAASLTEHWNDVYAVGSIDQAALDTLVPHVPCLPWQRTLEEMTPQHIASTLEALAIAKRSAPGPDQITYRALRPVQRYVGEILHAIFLHVVIHNGHVVQSISHSWSTMLSSFMEKNGTAWYEVLPPPTQ